MIFSVLNGSAEVVGPGHPDIFCDGVADAILDAMLKQDPRTRAGIEMLAKDDWLVISGEVSTEATVDIPAIARSVAAEVGYDYTPEVEVRLQQQSPDIAQGVDVGGAGDQGGMWGFYTSQSTSGLHPAMHVARQLILRLCSHELRAQYPWLRPDIKAQVVISDHRVEDVVLAVQHTDDVDIETVRAAILEDVVHPVAGNTADRISINGTGRFVLGGPRADAGVVGRKIVVAQGGYGQPVGGGALSGKDPSKVDRSAVYMAHWVARQLVRRGLTAAALVHVCYGIGLDRPCKVWVYTPDSPVDPDIQLSRIATNGFDWRPQAIIELFGLTTPTSWSYKDSALYGAFGHARTSRQFPWEQFED